MVSFVEKGEKVGGSWERKEYRVRVRITLLVIVSQVFCLRVDQSLYERSRLLFGIVFEN